MLTQVKSATHNRFSVAQYVPRPSREVQMHGSGPFLNSRESSYTVTAGQHRLGYSEWSARFRAGIHLTHPHGAPGTRRARCAWCTQPDVTRHSSSTYSCGLTGTTCCTGGMAGTPISPTWSIVNTTPSTAAERDHRRRPKAPCSRSSGPNVPGTIASVQILSTFDPPRTLATHLASHDGRPTVD